MRLVSFSLCFAVLCGWAQPPVFPPGEQGIRELALYLAESAWDDREAFSRTLKPGYADVEALFTSNAAPEVFRYLEGLHKSFRILIHPLRTDQTEIRIWSADASDLAEYTGEAVFFPGGYREIAGFLKPGIPCYRIKYASPDRYLGASFDLFAHVNGGWKFFPQVWKVWMP